MPTCQKSFRSSIGIWTKGSNFSHLDSAMIEFLNRNRKIWIVLLPFFHLIQQIFIFLKEIQNQARQLNLFSRKRQIKVLGKVVGGSSIKFQINYDSINMFINRVVSHLLVRSTLLTWPFSTGVGFFKKRGNRQFKLSIEKDNKEQSLVQSDSTWTNNQRDEIQEQTETIQHSALDQSLRDCLAGQHYSIHSLLSFKDQVFKIEPKTIHLFLSALMPHINKQNYSSFQSDFNFINQEIDNFSQQLKMTPQEFLAVLDYKFICQQFDQKKQKYDFDSFKFQKKLTMICATLIHQKKFTLNQTIYVFETLVKLNLISILLFMNFVKYIKAVFLEKPNKVTLIQLITILNVRFIKENKTILQNVLYDWVLNHLLTHLHTYLLYEPIQMKVEVLAILLKIQSKKCYKSNILHKQLWIKRLLTEITETTEDAWAQQLCCLGKATYENQVNCLHIINIIQCICFAKENRFEDECFDRQFDLFTEKMSELLFKNLNEINEIPKVGKLFKSLLTNQEYLIRLLFNPQFIQTWIKNSERIKVVEKIIRKITFTTEEQYYPIIDSVYSFKNQQGVIEKLVLIARQAYKAAKKNQLIVWGLLAQQIEFFPLAKAKKIVTQELLESDLVTKDPLSYSILIDFSSKLLKINVPITKLSHDNLFEDDAEKGIQILLKVIKNFRNVQLPKCFIQDLFETCHPLKTFIQSIYARHQQAIENDNLVELMMFAFCQNKYKIDPHFLATWQKMFKLYRIKTNLLVSLYQNNSLHPKKYQKKINLLSNSSTFKARFDVISQYCGDEKFTYFIWDVFLANYVRLPLESRKASFNHLVKLFAAALQKQKLRKMIMVMVFTNYASSGIIVASKNELQNIIQTCLDQLMKENEVYEFHYQCYVQIIVNALALNVLTMEYFDKVIKHAVHKNSQLMKHTTTLMLLYGSFVIQHKTYLQNPQQMEMIESQKKYLRYLAGKDKIQVKTIKSSDKQNLHSKQANQNLSEYTLTAKLIVIYMRTSTRDVLILKDKIFQYMQSANDFKEWIMVANCFNPSQYSDQNPRQKEFKKKMTQILLQKMTFFKTKELLTDQYEKNISEKLK